MQPESNGRVPDWDPTASASLWINRAARFLGRLQDTKLRPFGFGMSQMPVLHALQQGAALPQKELAARANVEQPTMAEMLMRMQRDGLVERVPNPNDGRGNLTSLTQRARSRFPKARLALVQVEQHALRGFSIEEKRTLVALLERVVCNLADDLGPTP
jgi:MarR family transcriptional regulator, transcriptional regulator for hemolysin